MAIAENRFGEKLLYVLAAMLAVVGVGILVYATLKNQPVGEIAGAIAAALCWPAIASARRTRKESVAIRLLEAALTRADTAQEATEVLAHVFRSLMVEKPDEKQPRLRRKAAK